MTEPSETPATVRLDVHRGVAVVTLARPDRLNAMTGELVQSLRDVMASLGERLDVRAIVIAGDGPAFCAGLDLEEGLIDPRYADPIEGSLNWMRIATEAIWTMRSIPQPIICAVHGWAVGAGFALAAASDVRIIGPEARFSAPFLKLGMSVGDLGLSWFLPRIIGAGRAARVFFDAGVIDAEKAVAYGLATEVVGDPLLEAIAYAERVASLPPYGVHASKRLLNGGSGTGLRDHLDAEARAQVIGNSTEAARQAFATALVAMSHKHR